MRRGIHGALPAPEQQRNPPFFGISCSNTQHLFRSIIWSVDKNGFLPWTGSWLAENAAAVKLEVSDGGEGIAPRSIIRLVSASRASGCCGLLPIAAATSGPAASSGGGGGGRSGRTLKRRSRAVRKTVAVGPFKKVKNVTHRLGFAEVTLHYSL